MNHTERVRYGGEIQSGAIVPLLLMSVFSHFPSEKLSSIFRPVEGADSLKSQLFGRTKILLGNTRFRPRLTIRDPTDLWRLYPPIGEGSARTTVADWM